MVIRHCESGTIDLLESNQTDQNFGPAYQRSKQDLQNMTKSSCLVFIVPILNEKQQFKDSRIY